MAPRTVDVVASGPPAADLYDPAAPAWALAGGLAARGHSVHVTFPSPPEAPEPPVGLLATPFPAVTAHVGSPLGDAELTHEAARHLRPSAEVVIRDPSGLGPLGHRAGRRAVVAFVRSLSTDAAASPAEGGLRGKLLGWGERRGVRRLEREALAEATAICCSTSAQRELLTGAYGVAAERVRITAPAVAPVEATPGREAARRRLVVPDDVPLAIVLPPVDPADAPSLLSAVEAYRRTRPIFTGARLVIVGVPDVTGPGIVALPARDPPTVAGAVAAADVAIACASGALLDPGVVLALRAGVPTVVAPSAPVGEEADGSVRRVNVGDAGELASVLAELFADPEGRRVLGEKGRAHARRFDPGRLAEELETAGALGAG
jgi:hypothetical protein